MKKFKDIISNIISSQINEEIYSQGGTKVEYSKHERETRDRLHRSGISISRRRSKLSAHSLKRLRKLTSKGHSRHGSAKKRTSSNTD